MVTTVKENTRTALPLLNGKDLKATPIPNPVSPGGCPRSGLGTLGQRSGIREIREEGPEPGVRGLPTHPRLFDEGVENGRGGCLMKPKNQEERLGISSDPAWGLGTRVRVLRETCDLGLGHQGATPPISPPPQPPLALTAGTGHRQGIRK